MRWNHRTTGALTVALVAAFSLPETARAQFVMYDNQASFLAAITNSGLDAFSDISRNGETASPLLRAAGAYGYRATVTAGAEFYGTGSAADTWLSTNTSTDAITFTDFTGGVDALGGNFFGSNFAGAYQDGDIVVTYVDAAGAQSTTLTGPSTGSFFGVVSLSRSLTAFTVASVQPLDGALWPTVNNLRLGTTTVPEPGSVVLLASGLFAVGIAARRRRA